MILSFLFSRPIVLDWRKRKQCTYVQSEAGNRICSVLIWLSLVEQDQERVQSSKRAPFSCTSQTHARKIEAAPPGGQQKLRPTVLFYVWH